MKNCCFQKWVQRNIFASHNIAFSMRCLPTWDFYTWQTKGISKHFVHFRYNNPTYCPQSHSGIQRKSTNVIHIWILYIQKRTNASHMHVYENIQKYTCIRYRCVPKYTNKSHTHISIYIFVYKHVLHSLYFAPRVDKYILHLSTRRIHMYICLPNQVCVRHFQFKETTLQNTHTTNTHPNKYICTYTYEYAYIHIYEQECAFAMWGL